MDIDRIEPAPAGRPGVLGMVTARAVVQCLRSIAAVTDQTFVESSASVGRIEWESADLVVVDAEAARACAARLPRRDRVVVVSDGAPTLADWQAATAVGADRVLGVPDDEAVLVTVFGERGTRSVADGAVVVVTGGAGGAGASSLAAAVALEAGRPRDGRATAPWTLLVDADPLGGGLDLLLGIEGDPGLRWSGLAVEGGRVSADALRAALPARGSGLSVLACGRGRAGDDRPTPAAAAAVVEAGRNAGGLVVCDVPRHPSAVGDVLLDAADLAVVVVPATVRGGLAAERVLAQVSERNPNQGIVIRGPAPGGLRGVDLADRLGVPLLAAVRPEPRIDAMLERGGLDLGRRSPLAAAARAVLDILAARPRRGRWAA
ncbi:septum site-determining protein Ssd [Prescottella agglutinans]|uniref:Secretion/DNA translocation related CpaE-like protein n=1 Tax=Prescottella agglutinans TaxID=1644129 RepID=A0ABT6MKH6_9NOCA|nr:septum site-determining protein Ssd [Prescottella agglutinans]MDH6284405.1 secretion/DNA translocation related CpaE-like protein [Prescottella agglutinans]